MRKLTFWNCRVTHQQRIWHKLDCLEKNQWWRLLLLELKYMRRYLTRFSKALHEHFQENGSVATILKKKKKLEVIKRWNLLSFFFLRSWPHRLFYLVKLMWNEYCYHSLLFVYCITIFTDKQPSIHTCYDPCFFKLFRSDILFCLFPHIFPDTQYVR